MLRIPSGQLKQLKDTLIREYGLSGLDILLPMADVYSDPYGRTGIVTIYTEKGPFSAKYYSGALERADDWRSFYTSIVRDCARTYIDTPSIETRAEEDEEPLFIL